MARAPSPPHSRALDSDSDAELPKSSLADTDRAVFARLREEYMGAPLHRDAIERDPVEQFRRWFDEVVALSLPLANGMTLATADGDGRLSARIVLLKSYDARGFVFYTNYDSRKGAALRENPHAALLFWWQPLQRQVRIEGSVERIAESESDAYFETRPRASNLSAMASPQSREVSDREWLENRVESARRSFADRPLKRPPEWGGYRVVPDRFEFWQGRPDRLHDRLCYTRESADDWRLVRLAP